ncbi:unnamed protein product, partial [Amoebophrya sp. A25]|eukprot:GSA25T00005274001.1
MGDLLCYNGEEAGGTTSVSLEENKRSTSTTASAGVGNSASSLSASLTAGPQMMNNHGGTQTTEASGMMATQPPNQVTVEALPSHRKDPAKNWSPIDRILLIKKTQAAGRNKLQTLSESQVEWDANTIAAQAASSAGPPASSYYHDIRTSPHLHTTPAAVADRTWRSCAVQTTVTSEMQEKKRQQLEDLLVEESRKLSEAEANSERERASFASSMAEQQRTWEAQEAEYGEQAGIQQQAIETLQKLMQNLMVDSARARTEMEQLREAEREKHAAEMRERILEHEEVVKKLSADKEELLRAKTQAEDERDSMMVSLETEQALLLARVETLQMEMEEKRRQEQQRWQYNPGASPKGGKMMHQRGNHRGSSAGASMRVTGEMLGGSSAAAFGGSTFGSQGPQPTLAELENEIDAAIAIGTAALSQQPESSRNRARGLSNSPVAVSRGAALMPGTAQQRCGRHAAQHNSIEENSNLEHGGLSSSASASGGAAATRGSSTARPSIFSSEPKRGNNYRGSPSRRKSGAGYLAPNSTHQNSTTAAAPTPTVS